MNRRRSLSIRGLSVAAASLSATLLFLPVTRAETLFGVRTGVYTDTQAGFLGAEALTSMAPAWYFDPNIEYAFVGDRQVLTLNGDFHYDVLRDRPYDVWAGAGPALVHRELSGGEYRNDLGVNLIGGIGWKNQPRVIPYVQGKVTVSDTTEAVLAVGLRF